MLFVPGTNMLFVPGTNMLFVPGTHMLFVPGTFLYGTAYQVRLKISLPSLHLKNTS